MDDFNLALCNEKHINITKEFDAVWKRMNNIETKLWAIIVLLIANLATMVGMVVKSF